MAMRVRNNLTYYKACLLMAVALLAGAYDCVVIYMLPNRHAPKNYKLYMSGNF